MNNLRLRATEHDSYYVEPIDVAGTVETAHPVSSCLRHLPLLSPVHGAKWATIRRGRSRLDLDEGNHPLLAVAAELGDEIDVAMSASKPPVHDPPPSLHQPPFGDALTALSEYLTGGEHGDERSAVILDENTQFKRP